MKNVESYRSLDRMQLNRCVVTPDSSLYGPPRAGVVVVHGLGDHIGRYDEVMGRLADRGVVCVGADLPGHGRSECRRGHVASIETAHEVVRESFARAAEELPPGKPIGIVAHSTGAFLALIFLMRHPEVFRFAWLNGALIDPSHGQSWWKPYAARMLARVFPTLTISTQVRASMCVHHPGPPDPLKHGRVSLVFGNALLDGAIELQECVGEIDPDLELLMTHGDADVVCPPSLAEALFERIPARRKRWCLVKGGLHETFRDDVKEDLFEEVDQWAGEVLDRGEERAPGG